METTIDVTGDISHIHEISFAIINYLFYAEYYIGVNKNILDLLLNSCNHFIVKKEDNSA